MSLSRVESMLTSINGATSIQSRARLTRLKRVTADDRAITITDNDAITNHQYNEKIFKILADTYSIFSIS